VLLAVSDPGGAVIKFSSEWAPQGADGEQRAEQDHGVDAGASFANEVNIIGDAGKGGTWCTMQNTMPRAVARVRKKLTKATNSLAPGTVYDVLAEKAANDALLIASQEAAA